MLASSITRGLGRGLGALAIALLGGCAILYDFEDDGAGGATGSTGASASSQTPPDGSNAVDAASANTATSAAISSGGTDLVEGVGVLVGSSEPDAAAQRGVTSTPSGPAIGVYLGATIAEVNDAPITKAYGTAALRFGTDLKYAWGDLATDSEALLTVSRSVRETMVARLDGGNVLVGGTAVGSFAPNGAAVPDFPTYRTAFVASYDPSLGTATHFTFAESTDANTARITMDGLTTDMNGGVLLGLTVKRPTTIEGCEVLASDSAVAVLSLSSSLVCNDHLVLLDVVDAYMVDLQPRPNGYTVTTRVGQADTGQVFAVIDGTKGIPATVPGAAILAPGTLTTQMYCVRTDGPEPEIVFGRIDIDSDANANATELAHWSAGADGDIGCTDIVPFGDDFLVGGFYRGQSFDVVIDDPVNTDGFLAHVTATGTIVRAWRVGGDGVDRVQGLAVDPALGAVYASGATSDGFMFGGMRLVPKQNDAFLVRFDPI